MIVQKKFPPGYYTDWNNVKKELDLVMAQNNGLIPPRPVLRNQGFAGLIYALKKYYGGVKAVRKKLGVDCKKKCKICKIVKNIKLFVLGGPSKALNSIGHPRYKTVCKKCSHKISKDKLENDWDFLINSRFLEVKRRAKKKNLDFDLDIAWLKGKLEASNYCCEITGIPFNRNRNLTGGSYAFSFDRIASSKGYKKSNTRIILNCLNWGLNKFSDSNFIPVAIGFLKANGYEVRLLNESD